MEIFVWIVEKVLDSVAFIFRSSSVRALDFFYCFTLVRPLCLEKPFKRATQ